MGNSDSIATRVTEGKVRFTVNGKVCEVGSETPPETKLVSYLRETLLLTGTKLSCGEGGCGTCIVTVSYLNPGTGMPVTRPVNSCLTRVLSCDGWEISTIEHLGSRRKGLHPLQSTLAAFNGTQCGFCSPGMIMTVNSVLRENESPSMETLEKSIDGNICRCTGYRPILDAFKSFAGTPGTSCSVDLDTEDIVPDIEDLGWVCPQKNNLNPSPADVYIETSSGRWYSPNNLENLLSVLKLVPEECYTLVAGSTGPGVYKDDNSLVQHFIDVSKIVELRSHTESPLELGGGITIHDSISILRKVSRLFPEKYAYTEQVAEHLEKVANLAVRSVGTLAGNLELKRKHRSFPSDVFTLLETVGASIEVVSPTSKVSCFFPSEYLETQQSKQVIVKIRFPALSEKCNFQSYKISSRKVNAHAYISAGFLAKTEPGTFKLLEKPNLVFTGVSGDFIRAVETEKLLENQDLSDQAVLDSALKSLGSEVTPDPDPRSSDPAFRVGLVQALFYRFVLNLLGDMVPSNLRSGVQPLQRGVSLGVQEFETDPSLYPINKPVQKLEAESQCSGEAEYTGDKPVFHNQLYAAFVLSTQGNCDLESVDPSAALDLPGVVGFMSQEDISGDNNFSQTKPWKEEIFATTKVLYAGQAVGLLVAENEEVARKASKLVKISYTNIQEPVLTLQEAIKHPEKIEPTGDPIVEGDVEKELKGSAKTVSGEFEIGSQYPFHLETQICISVPKEDGFDIYCSTQYIDKVQTTVASVLGVQLKDINISVKRLGGAFGAKISRPNQLAAACALASKKFNRPVKLQLDLKTNMEMIGKRLPFLARYKVGVDDSGTLTGVRINIFCDSGSSHNEFTADAAVFFAKICYQAKAWNLVPQSALTNTPSNTYIRAPGTTQGHAIMENIMEHLAAETGTDPLELRLHNIPEDPSYDSIREIIKKLRESSDYDLKKQQVLDFNQNNRWKKKGLSLVPIKYRHDYGGARFNVLISVYRRDGSVAVSHGGIEMGQGINTKVCQVVAKELGIPMEMVSIKPTDSFTNPNASLTGGSMGSECNCSAALIACQKLKEQMKPVAEKLKNPTWLELVTKCYNQGVDLSARHMGHSSKDGLIGYNIWAAVLTQVKVDVLTGEMNIESCNLIEDTGTSISPDVDVGQVEGGLIMGLGLWTSEQIRYDKKTGRLLDNSSWEYKVPSAMDIPEKMRIEFYNSGHNPGGVLGSKATGEPSVLAGVSVLTALRQAIRSARQDSNLPPWFQFNGPATVEAIKLGCSVDVKNMKLQ